MRRHPLALPTLVASVVLGAGTASSATASADPAPRPFAVEAGPADVAGGLTVLPRTALIDVALRPGETRVAEAALTNRASVPVSVSSTTDVVGTRGPGEITSLLQLATRLGPGCTVDAMAGAPATSLDSATGVPLGTLDPGESTSLCASVALPADSTLPAGTSVTFSIVLDSIEHDSGPEPAALPWSELTGVLRDRGHVVAGALAALGAAVLLARHPRRSDRHLRSVPHRDT